MNLPATKTDILEKLQKEILLMQGFRAPSERERLRTGLGPIEQAFPNKVFPTAAVHEFLSSSVEDAAATAGFMTGLLSSMMQHEGSCIWISSKRSIFPPALKALGIEPDRVIFIDLDSDKEILWVIEEALKCDSLAAVIGEISAISFTQSRRLQLAVEQSRVTGLLHRYQPRDISNLACVSRWKISPLASITEDGMPGVGFPRWNVQLLKVRNGKPGTWPVQWSAGGFQHFNDPISSIPSIQIRKTG